MGDHRLMQGKMTAFDTDIGVPLIVVGPGVPAGRTVGKLTGNIDLRPTFSQLAGAGVPGRVDGHSLVPLLHGAGPGSWRTATLVEHHGPDQDQSDPDFQSRASGNPPSYEAIRKSNAVYVEYKNGDREYYDIASRSVRARQHLRGAQRRAAGAAARHADRARELQRAGLLGDAGGG